MKEISKPDIADPEVRALSLAEQRQVLRQQLSAQRRLIINRIDPPEEDMADTYPRSRTMRFLTQRSGLVLQIAAGLFGGRVIRSLTKTYAVAKVVRSLIRPR